jgi:hypothetical protein
MINKGGRDRDRVIATVYDDVSYDTALARVVHADEVRRRGDSATSNTVIVVSVRHCPF